MYKIEDENPKKFLLEVASLSATTRNNVELQPVHATQ